MSRKEPRVELMGGGSGRSGGYLEQVYDAETGTHFFPETPGMAADPRSLVCDIDDGAIAMAFVDSGVLGDHPVIRPRLRHAVDFTGEGPEDRNGHGTLVTLLGVAVSPNTALVSVKALDRTGFGRRSWLAGALRWCAENAGRFDIRVVNLSAGVIDRKWGFLECRGDCEVCEAARTLRESGILLVAAAGNQGPDEMACPQRVGLLEDAFLVVAAADPLTGEVTDYSGRGTIAAPEARIRKVPLDGADESGPTTPDEQ